jgi:hypothetical protein
MLMMIVICLTFTGSQNFIKHLTNKDSLLAPKKCSTKLLSVLLTNILTAVKERLQIYCATVYARSGVNQMWILENLKELLESLKSPIFSQIYSIKTYDFTTLYTTIPHDKLKD